MSGEYEQDVKIARALRDEVAQAEAAGKRRSWRKVTTLLELFGYNRLTATAQDRIARAFDEVGLVVQPSMREATRADTVRLALRTSTVAPGGEPAIQLSDVSAEVWRPGAPPAHIRDLQGVWPGAGVLVVTIDPAAEPTHGWFALLAPHCPGLTEEMLEDVLAADQEPKVRVHDGGVRCVSTFGVHATDDLPNVSPHSRSKAGVLTFNVVEFVIGHSWVIVCCHEPSEEGADLTPAVGQARPRTFEVSKKVARAWQERGLQTAGDISLLVATELAGQYAPARRAVAAWLEQWEYDMTTSDSNNIELETPAAARTAIGDFRRRLSALNASKHDADDDRWFPELTKPDMEEQLDDRVDRALSHLSELSDSLRSGLVLAQTRKADDARDRTERFQKQLSTGGAVLLGPALVAGLWGANVALPGKDSWAGFAMVVVLMVAVAIGAFVWIQKRDLKISGR